MNTPELLPSRNSSAGGEEEEVDRYPVSREGAKARLVQQDPRGDITSYPARGSERAASGLQEGSGPWSGAWGRHVVGWRATMREDGKWAQGGC